MDTVEQPLMMAIMRPGLTVTADLMHYWIALNLQNFPNREQLRWRVWVDKLGHMILKKDPFKRFYEMDKYDWIKVHSPFSEKWIIRVKVGVEGGITDFDDEVILDKISIHLEIDDGTIPGMP